MTLPSSIAVDCRHSTDLAALRQQIRPTLQLHHCVHLLLPTGESAPTVLPDELLNLSTHDAAVQSTLAAAYSYFNFNDTSFSQLIAPSWPYETVCEIFRVEDSTSTNSMMSSDGTVVTHKAYTTSGLPLHTDMPYLPTPPHYQLLHCIQPAADGGVSTFVNARAVVQDLSHVQPAVVKLLASQRVRFYAAAGTDRRSEAFAPVLQLDEHTNQVQCLRLGQTHVAVPGTPSPADSIEDVALRQQWLHAVDNLYSALQHAPLHQRHTMHLQANEAVLFDNHVMVHDRSSFTSADRRMHGVYLNLTE